MRMKTMLRDRIVIALGNLNGGPDKEDAEANEQTADFLDFCGFLIFMACLALAGVMLS